MKWLPKKVRSSLYNKTTLMVIPHSEKGISTFNLSHLNLALIGSAALLVLILGIFFNFQLKEKSFNYEYFRQENKYYKKQIENIHNILPNITKSQNSLSDKLHGLLGTLGLKSAQSLSSDNSKLDEKYTVSQLDNIEGKMKNISSYIRSFRSLFKKIPSIFPLITRKYWFTSPYGVRTHPITMKRQFHPAIDIAAFPGTPIQAAADGEISYAGWRGGYGIVAYVTHKKGYETRYAHMLRLGTRIKKGGFVRKGQIIGYVGSTGVSTGYHLHYEIRLNGKPVNPNYYIWLDRFWR